MMRMSLAQKEIVFLSVSCAGHGDLGVPLVSGITRRVSTHEIFMAPRKRPLCLGAEAILGIQSDAEDTAPCYSGHLAYLWQ